MFSMHVPFLLAMLIKLTRGIALTITPINHLFTESYVYVGTVCPTAKCTKHIQVEKLCLFIHNLPINQQSLLSLGSKSTRKISL